MNTCSLLSIDLAFAFLSRLLRAVLPARSDPGSIYILGHTKKDIVTSGLRVYLSSGIYPPHPEITAATAALDPNGISQGLQQRCHATLANTTLIYGLAMHSTGKWFCCQDKISIAIKPIICNELSHAIFYMIAKNLDLVHDWEAHASDCVWDNNVIFDKVHSHLVDHTHRSEFLKGLHTYTS